MHTEDNSPALSQLASAIGGAAIGIGTCTAVMTVGHGSISEAVWMNGPFFYGLAATSTVAGAAIEVATKRRSTWLSAYLAGPAAVAAMGLLGTGFGAYIVNNSTASVEAADQLTRLSAQGMKVALHSGALGSAIGAVLSLYAAGRVVFRDAMAEKRELVETDLSSWFPAIGAALLGGGAIWAAQIPAGVGMSGLGVLLTLFAGVALASSASRRLFERPAHTLASVVAVAATTLAANAAHASERIAAMNAILDASTVERFAVATEHLATANLALMAVPAWATLALIGALLTRERPRFAGADVVFGLGGAAVFAGLIYLGFDQVAQVSGNLLDAAITLVE